MSLEVLEGYGVAMREGFTVAGVEFNSRRKAGKGSPRLYSSSSLRPRLLMLIYPHSPSLIQYTDCHGYLNRQRAHPSNCIFVMLTATEAALYGWRRVAVNSVVPD